MAWHGWQSSVVVPGYSRRLTQLLYAARLEAVRGELVVMRTTLACGHQCKCQSPKHGERSGDRKFSR
jgi:hypothetical protein